MSPNLDVANAALPAYVGSLLFFVGCLLRVKDMPGYWQWYSYLNFLRYGWGALMVNQFEGRNAIFLGGEEVRSRFVATFMWQWPMWKACKISSLQESAIESLTKPAPMLQNDAAHPCLSEKNCETSP